MSRKAGVAVCWLRRDLRLADNPALLAAASAGAVLPLFVLDPVLLRRAGEVRTRWLHAGLRALDADLRVGGGPGLTVVAGRPAEAVPAVAAATGATEVHVSADFGPYGRRRDAAVAAALAESGAALVATGSPYAVAPGTLRNGSGLPFRVFTPFHRAWEAHGMHGPAERLDPASASWVGQERARALPGRVPLPEADPDDVAAASEGAAREAWADFLQPGTAGVSGYKTNQNLPGADATSRLSVPLRWGQLHPRTLLADLAGSELGRTAGGAALARQLAWRDFFADALLQRPDAVSAPIRAEFARLPVEEPGPAFEAWKQGRTGYPLVDAGMRQLLAEGWMHNRVRMLTASFLTKDLHIGWWHGAAWFMERLRDGDLAQNQLNWQWVAGCGLDAAPYYRVFNPTTQAEKFDPDGAYIRRWVPELRDLPTQHLAEPWDAPGGPPAGYPAPIVDHKTERLDALERYNQVRIN
ncbi:deoxyribodipyrimidine photo-lyase [Friedmanniella endophytica]|uniref:Deoxyribodipyrimidine photo-lyase n=1 Tax=Microlunatus kandeliicorticis TaxID=1759536 RepID=A0A7W3IT04_9ACTN|nr:deoxyribodipyrimidine photo-lyase [Microlunatus kandeliicorticis]MBA8794660.1 deoxyribodipyrimidine photo-lyase [Microlunatus kandeliicorticis]